jgi:hypothetical protein
MRVIFGLLLILIATISRAETISLVDIPSHVFVHQGKTNFDSLIHHNDLVEKVEALFNQELLYHDYTLEVHPNSNFKTYWSVFEKNWGVIDLNNDGVYELIFQGRVSSFDEKEYVEIFKKNEDNWERIHSDVGRLLAYKIHPNTKKIILYQHRYPCCYSASHSIIMVRLIGEKIITKSRFFVGRDGGDMVGPFYPDSVSYSSAFKQLTSKTLLRWSPAVVDSKAFINYSETNAIIHYEKGGYYKELYKKNGWAFVLMYSGIVHEQAVVINSVNFVNTPVYGWIFLEKA